MIKLGLTTSPAEHIRYLKTFGDRHVDTISLILYQHELLQKMYFTPMNTPQFHGVMSQVDSYFQFFDTAPKPQFDFKEPPKP